MGTNASNFPYPPIMPRAGQRSGLLTRLMMANTNTLSDCELLELALSSVAAGNSAGALAIRLLERFRTINAVMHEEARVLKQVEGVDDAVVHALVMMRLVAERMLKCEVVERSVINSWEALVQYCQLVAGHGKVEEFRVLFLDHTHKLIADEVMQRGTVNHTPVYPREIVKRALELSAGALVLVHNHPPDDATPSQADIEVTANIVKAAATVNIVVHDHLIVTPSGHYSLKSLGLM